MLSNVHLFKCPLFEWILDLYARRAVVLEIEAGTVVICIIKLKILHVFVLVFRRKGQHSANLSTSWCRRPFSATTRPAPPSRPEIASSWRRPETHSTPCLQSSTQWRKTQIAQTNPMTSKAARLNLNNLLRV